LSVTLTPGRATLAQLENIWRSGSAATLHKDARPAVDAAHALVTKAAAGNEAVYGVNTGFGKLASVKIASEDTATLQRNLILSHCCGVGEPLDVNTTRFMMALKLLSLGRGASGVAWSTVAQIENMLEKGVTPVVPDQGSVGASGDLAPLAHMAAAMMAEGEGLDGIELGAKEGLGLINGTQFSTACALTGLFKAWRNASTTIVSASLSTDAIMGSTAPLVDNIHTLRGHAGQIAVATVMVIPVYKTPIAFAASHR